MSVHRPDFSGIWRLDPAASHFSGPAPAALLMKIEHREGELIQQIIATDPAGAEQRRLFTCLIGKETISTIGETVLRSIAYWQVDSPGELVIETLMSRQDRVLEFRDCWSLSADESQLTMAHRDDALAGQTVILIRDETAAAAFDDDPTPA
jgi:hypothetical protein